VQASASLMRVLIAPLRVERGKSRVSAGMTIKGAEARDRERTGPAEPRGQ